MDNHLYFNFYITDKLSSDEFEIQNGRVVASVFINNASKTISIIDHTQLLFNSSNGLFGGVNVTDLIGYLYEAKALIRCAHDYTNDEIKKIFTVAVMDYNSTRDDIKIVMV